MIGHITAPAGAIDRYFSGRQDVQFLPAAPESENVRMLDQE
jgi:hypothetical protein